MRKKAIMLLVLLALPALIYAQECSCIDLQDRIRFIQETDTLNYANIKAQLDMQQNNTQLAISKNNIDLKNYIDANDRALYADMHKALVAETSPYKQVIPMALASLTIVTLFITYMVWRGK